MTGRHRLIALAWSALAALVLSTPAGADKNPEPKRARGIYVKFFDPIEPDDDKDTIAEKKKGRLIPLNTIHEQEADDVRRILWRKVDLTGGFTVTTRLPADTSSDKLKLCKSYTLLADKSYDCQRD